MPSGEFEGNDLKSDPDNVHPDPSVSPLNGMTIDDNGRARTGGESFDAPSGLYDNDILGFIHESNS